MALSASIRRLIEKAFGNRGEAKAFADIIDSTLGVSGSTISGSPTSGNIPIGSGVAWVSQALSGDVTVNSSGVSAIGAQKVLMAMMVRGTNGQIIVAQTGAAPAYKTMSGDLTIDENAAATLNASLKKQTVLIPIEDLSSDGDIADRIVFARSAGCTLTGASLLAQGAFSGLDDTNAIVVLLKDGGGNTIVTKTYDDGTNGSVPVDNDINDLGTLDPANKILTSNEVVTLSITCDSSADPPAMILRLEFTPTNV